MAYRKGGGGNRSQGVNCGLKRVCRSMELKIGKERWVGAEYLFRKQGRAGCPESWQLLMP